MPKTDDANLVVTILHGSMAYFNFGEKTQNAYSFGLAAINLQLRC